MTNTNSTKRRCRMAREPQTQVNSQAAPSVKGLSENAAATPAPEKGPNKTEKVLSLLQRRGGATLDELVEVTGWLPHTARAALTGLKKKGHAIQRTKIDGVSRYAMAETATQ